VLAFSLDRAIGNPICHNRSAGWISKQYLKVREPLGGSVALVVDRRSISPGRAHEIARVFCCRHFVKQIAEPRLKVARQGFDLNEKTNSSTQEGSRLDAKRGRSWKRFDTFARTLELWPHTHRLWTHGRLDFDWEPGRFARPGNVSWKVFGLAILTHGRAVRNGSA
jgi:hypothetical protein